MKVSNLIKQIIKTANEKFGTTDHNNDNITVSLFFDEDGDWQAWLQRPHHYSLLNPETFGIDAEELERAAVVTKFQVSHSSLIKTLKMLNDCVENADPSDFDFLAAK